VGPVLAGLRVPLVIYADDVLLLAESEADAQALLDVLALFCMLFGMRVNLAPRKTCAVVFRPAGQVPSAANLVFQGQSVPVQDTYAYLGVAFHATRGLQGAPGDLAASGTRAMHAMLGRLRACGVSQFDLRARMFDALVEPVLSYAAHVWGPTLFRACLRAGQQPTLASAPDKLHLHFSSPHGWCGACQHCGAAA
jgi:hypothetical protein